MSKAQMTPWHQVCILRDDLRTGELSLAIFAADLYDVAMDAAKPIYQDPREFFSLTYATHNIRELAKDIILRLAGKNEKAVRQLELTYGGGKTHTLIVLYHLVNDPDHLPDLPAVEEFIQHAGMKPPKARVAVLAFDKLDVERGMEVRGLDGKTRWLKHPWSVLAYQLGGDAGLELISGSTERERESPPAENLLRDLLAMPAQQGEATLVLIDEVLMYAREKVEADPAWRHKLLDFFQCLTQAATKVDRAAVVASLLATDPRKSDSLGKEIMQEIYAIFRREREEGVQPVVKEDVAEILRRRFFTPDSIRDREAFRPHVVAALQGIKALDEQTAKDAKNAEERLLRSYPFHPDVTDIFYSKWTNLEGFQRTRGVLRTFAMALRAAEQWDDSPLIGTNVFLSPPGVDDISEAARELASIAATEEYEGRRQEWPGILSGELEKARAIQAELPALRNREMEQVVFGTFLHSQPIGAKAHTRELLVLVGPTRPDKIELEKGLHRWTETSWFLDEGAISDRESSDLLATAELPRFWRLGSRPNLRQMHSDACTRVSPDLIEARLLDEISKAKNLVAGASAAGARVHVLPAKPSDIEDDANFHFAVLGPKAASDSGRPSAEAKRFIDETTSADKPRVYRNAVVLAVPSRDGLELLRNRIREYLGWEEVRSLPEAQHFDALRAELLNGYVDEARRRIRDVVQQAYSIVVTVGEDQEVHAFKIAVGSEPLFLTIKNDKRSRIQESAVSADALLPGGPYDLWREGETARRVSNLVNAFAQFAHLPKMLRKDEIISTLAAGVRDGFFVLRVTRPDRSARTIWRAQPTEDDLKDPSLELVLPATAEITEIASHLLSPGALPGLWPDPPAGITLAQVLSYFDGTTVAQVPRNGYQEPVPVPKAEREVVEAAVCEAIAQGHIWLLSGPASILKEPVPHGVLADTTTLNPPPAPISPADVLPESLPQAWQDGGTTAIALATALSTKAGVTLPWATICAAIDAAIRSRMVERTEDSGPWPCEWPGAQLIKLRLPAQRPEPRPEVREGDLRFVAEAQLTTGEVQNLAEEIANIVSAAVGYDVALSVKLDISDPNVPAEVVQRLNEVLAKVAGALRLEKRG
jgi:hypothetical protein